MNRIWLIPAEDGSGCLRDVQIEDGTSILAALRKLTIKMDVTRGLTAEIVFQRDDGHMGYAELPICFGLPRQSHTGESQETAKDAAVH